MIFVGDDWAEDHHDVFVCDADGTRLARRRLGEGVAGTAGFHALVAEHAEDPAEVVVGIETDRGLWVTALVEAGYQVFGVNPRAAARYRERHSMSGAKSDRGDARMLAELVRVDRHHHRMIAGDSAAVDAVKVLARAHQNLIWERTRTVLRLRSTLLEFFPAAVATFPELADRDALAVLAKASTPQAARALSVAKIRSALRAGGRQRNIDTRAADIAENLRVEHLEAPDEMADALGASVSSLVAVLVVTNQQIARLETELADRFEQHPDADIYRSLPGLGVILGARVLGEFGDDPNRYADAKSRGKLRRHVTHHPRIREPTRRHRPVRSQPSPRGRDPSLGVLRDHHQPRSESVLRPPPIRR